MAKTTVDNMVSKIKGKVDYDISDDDLDVLIIEWINDALKEMKQLFLDYGFYDEILAHDTFATTADQEYVDVATETVDFDEHISLTERDNDTQVGIISFAEYRARYPDPTAQKSATADVAAFGANRIYLGPTPNAATTYYLDYVKLLTNVASGDTLPFETKYDPVLKAIVRSEFVQWLDRKDSVGITTANVERDRLIERFITGAAHDIGINRQSDSR